MPHKVDARGLSCPQPVVVAKKTLESTREQVVQILVDNEAARENVSRFARSAGHQVEILPAAGNEYIVSITRAKVG
ncbi:MAG: preprotein translocase subunit TatB [Firmicutes bacterium]|nr:preprotein translocase subunit TatB [Bacillota bacterium]